MSRIISHGLGLGTPDEAERDGADGGVGEEKIRRCAKISVAFRSAKDDFPGKLFASRL